MLALMENNAQVFFDVMANHESIPTAMNSSDLRQKRIELQWHNSLMEAGLEIGPYFQVRT
jgi:hypothetical protein